MEQYRICNYAAICTNNVQQEVVLRRHVVENGTAIVTRIYPMNSYGDVITFKEQLICAYKGQGYQTYQGNYLSGSSTRLKGISALGGTMVSIDTINYSIIRCPVTQEMRGNVEGIY